MEVKLFIVGIALFWAGFVCAISFMEAWLKFKAEGVTLAIGLSIGKKIFKAMNRVEWFLFLFFILVMVSHGLQFHYGFIIALLLVIILLLQTFYLLPQLNKRAEIIMEGHKPNRSYVHIQYIATEFIKICILVFTCFIPPFG